MGPREQMSDVPKDALQRLIHERMRELRRSYGDVARLGGLSRSTVHHLATHGRSGRLPNPLTLERLAAGLDSQVGDDPEIDVLVASLVQLSPADRQHVAALVRSMLAAAKPAS